MHIAVTGSKTYQLCAVVLFHTNSSAYIQYGGVLIGICSHLKSENGLCVKYESWMDRELSMIPFMLRSTFIGFPSAMNLCFGRRFHTKCSKDREFITTASAFS